MVENRADAGLRAIAAKTSHLRRAFELFAERVERYCKERTPPLPILVGPSSWMFQIDWLGQTMSFALETRMVGDFLHGIIVVSVIDHTQRERRLAQQSFNEHGLIAATPAVDREFDLVNDAPEVFARLHLDAVLAALAPL